MTNTAAASQKLAAMELPSINFEARNAISIAADSGTIRAGSAVQKSSREPIVEMKDLSARILMQDGPAVLTANTGRYYLETEKVGVTGPVQFNGAGGYRLTTRDVDIDIKKRTMGSKGAVYGRMPLGTFSGNHFYADLEAKTVTLQGNARLRIEQNSIKGR